MSNLSTGMANPASVARVLDAALELFARSGFQRTSMADVARAAGVSRPWLYLHFDGKPALFAAMAAELVATALAAASEAWAGHPGKLRDRLSAAILAKDLRLYRLLASPHGAELLTLDAAATESFARQLEEGFAAILARGLEESGLGCGAFGGPLAFARLLTKLAAGLKHELRVEAEYVAGVRALCRMAARAVKRE